MCPVMFQSTFGAGGIRSLAADQGRRRRESAEVTCPLPAPLAPLWLPPDEGFPRYAVLAVFVALRLSWRGTGGKGEPPAPV